MSIVESAAHRAPRYSKEFDPQTCMVDPEHPITYSDIEEHELAHDAIERWIGQQTDRIRERRLPLEAARRVSDRELGLRACESLVTLYMSRGGELTPMPRAIDIDDTTLPPHYLPRTADIHFHRSAYLSERRAS